LRTCWSTDRRNQREVLLADRGYNTDIIVSQAQAAEMQVVIPPKRNRKVQREYDRDLYKLRHLVEKAFLLLKRWRGIATEYSKHSASILTVLRSEVSQSGSIFLHNYCLIIWYA
jgi:transposase